MSLFLAAFAIVSCKRSDVKDGVDDNEELRANEDKLTEQLRSLGCYVERDGSHPGSPIKNVGFPPRASMDGINQLKNCKKLQSVSFNGAPVTDEDLKGLIELTGITELWFHGPKITDAGVKMIARIESLRFLTLQEASNVTDAGIEHLASLKNLMSLNLDGTQLTDKALKHIKELSGLNFLSLGSTRITDEGAKDLAEMNGLITLSVDETVISDKGLAEIVESSNLKALELCSTKVTFAGLKKLRELTTLSIVTLREGDFSSEQVAELRKLLEPVSVFLAPKKKL